MRIILIALFVSFHFVCIAQKEMKSSTLKISYFGEMITHPGIKVGFEHSLLEKDKVKETKRKIKHKRHQLITGANLGAYTHFKYNTALFLNTEIGYRYIRQGGIIFETMIGIGYLRTFLNGKTYVVNKNGDVSNVFLAGSNSFMPSISFGFGHDVSQKSNRITSWFIKPVVFIQMPYNSSVLPHLALEAGVNLHLKKLRQ